MLVGLVAYNIQDWKDLQTVMSVVVLGLTLLWILMPESPRWLFSMNKYAEARKTLKLGATLNRRALPEGFLKYQDSSFVRIISVAKL